MATMSNGFRVGDEVTLVEMPQDRPKGLPLGSCGTIRTEVRYGEVLVSWHDWKLGHGKDDSEWFIPTGCVELVTESWSWEL